MLLYLHYHRTQVAQIKQIYADQIFIKNKKSVVVCPISVTCVS